MKQTSRTAVLLFILLTAGALVFAQSKAKPTVDVKDQKIENGTITIAKVVSDGPGWMDIHLDNNGNPGDSVGVAPVPNGESKDLKVQVDPTKVTTPKLIAMLHTDAGQMGVWEFPGPDMPVTVNGKVVMKTLTVKK